MKSAACANAERLGEFIDGELTGAERLRVARHLETCAICSNEEQTLRDLGQMLRGAAAQVNGGELAGLASGLMARMRAERAQSWRAILARGVEDWHWILVGAGSVFAAFVSILLVSAILAFGPVPQRDDSLAALFNNLGPAGTLFVFATPAGKDNSSMLMQFDNGEGPVQPVVPVVSDDLTGPTERDVVMTFVGSVVMKNGRLIDPQGMSAKDRRQAEALLDQITRFRLAAPSPVAGGKLAVHRIWLVTNTNVTGKAL